MKYLFNCSYCKKSNGNYFSTNNLTEFKKHQQTKKHLKCVEANETGTNLCQLCNKSFNDEEFKRHNEINKDYLELTPMLRERRLKNYTCGNYIVYHDYCPRGRRFKSMDDFYEWEEKREEAKEILNIRKQNNEEGVKKRLEYHLYQLKQMEHHKEQVAILRKTLDKYAEKREKRELKELKNKNRG